LTWLVLCVCVCVKSNPIRGSGCLHNETGALIRRRDMEMHKKNIRRSMERRPQARIRAEGGHFEKKHFVVRL